MANVVFSVEESNFVDVQDKLSSSNKGFENFERGNGGKQSNFYGGEGWGETDQSIDLRSTDYGFYPDELPNDAFLFPKYQQEEQEQRPCPDLRLLDDVRTFDVAYPPIQTGLDATVKLGRAPTRIQDVDEVPKKEKQIPFSFSTLELLNNYGSWFKRLKKEGSVEPSNGTSCTKVEGRKFSTEEIFRLAGEMFLRSSSCIADGLPMAGHPYHLSFAGLSDEETKDVQLAELLLASAEKVSCQQYDRASRLLTQCDYFSSDTGNPVQRVAYYFSEALQEKIDRETGRFTSKGLGKMQTFDLDEAMMSPNPATLACHKAVPFSQVAQFAGIQAIVENVTEAKRVHVIDLGIRNGIQWTILMQALVSRHECPLELLKITAVGTTSKHLIEDTGKRLTSFAKSMNLPFSFKMVMVSDMLDLKEDLFEVDVNEKVAVFSQFVLRSMIVVPNRLETIMRVIRNLNPCIMVLNEVEANHNSPDSMNRFIEALFFFSAYFDCLEACMKRDDPNRMVTESIYFSQGIRNIVAAEGDERKTRHVKIDVWRAFFARFGLLEAELSMSSLYQADLVIKKFGFESSCTIDMNGKCLLVGWRGTPLHSVSAWKFF